VTFQIMLSISTLLLV